MKNLHFSQLPLPALDTRASRAFGCLALTSLVALLSSACGDTPIAGEETAFAEREQELLGGGCVGDQVPIMTSASTPAGSVTTSGEFSSSYRAFQAFDSSPSTMWISRTFETPASLGYVFADGPRTVTSYAINYKNGRIRTRAPKDFTFQGLAADGWVVVDARSEETNWNGSERREYPVADPGAFSEYRLVVTDDNDSRAGVVVISIGDFELIGSSCE